MSRQRYLHYNASGRGGINQQAELARPGYELADARNVWAPNGRIEARPGSWGVAAMEDEDTRTATGGVIISENPVGTFVAAATGASTLSLNSWPVGSRWYYGTTIDLRGGTSGGNRIAAGVTTANSSASTFKAEYYNGSAWQHLNVTEYLQGATVTNGFHLSDTGGSVFFFTPPQDWTSTTVTVSGTDYDRYFIRFTVKEANFDSSVSITIGQPGDTNGDDRNAYTGTYELQYSNAKKFVHTYGRINNEGITFFQSDSVDPHIGRVKITAKVNAAAVSDTPATIAVISEFDEAFVSIKNLIFRLTPDTATSSVALPAAVEDRDFAVGSNAPYDPDYIAQLNAFPIARFISYFNNRIWVTGIPDDKFGIRWSAPAPYHKVWPALSREVLMEDDNSPITAMHPLGEQMVIFKQDSIWIMVDVGVDAFDLRQFVPKRVVAGVGCVANSSIKKVRGNLIFLAEDGVYAFDGTPNITKLSDKIDNTIQKINRGRKKFAVAGHWRSNNLYLLSASTTGSIANDVTFAWDYKNDSWWIWDTIDPQFWIEAEDREDYETLYFVNQWGHIMQMGLALTDNGTAISSYVTTHRFGRNDSNRKFLRYIEAESTNYSGASVTYEPLVNDEISGESGTTGTADFTDANDAGHERRREVRIGFRREFDWVQSKISHSTKNSKFKLSEIDMAYYRKGIR